MSDFDKLDGVSDPWRWSDYWDGWVGPAYHVTWADGDEIVPTDLGMHYTIYISDAPAPGITDDVLWGTGYDGDLAPTGPTVADADGSGVGFVIQYEPGLTHTVVPDNALDSTGMFGDFEVGLRYNFPEVPLGPDDIPEFAGCDWPLDPACLSEEWESTYDDLTRARAKSLAGLTLRRLTAYRVGGCPITLRPCQTACGCDSVHAWGISSFHPGIVNGAWVNNFCGCSGNCTCSSPFDYVLPPPVGGLVTVKVDGEAFTDWRIDSGNILVRTDGEPWPATQDLALADSEEGTWSVTYLNAYPVDGHGAFAAGILAVEFAKACKGGKGCRLPNNITALTRQGVTFDLITGAFPGGKTGLREVDQYVALWNPDNRRGPSTVWTPTNQVRYS